MLPRSRRLPTRNNTAQGPAEAEAAAATYQRRPALAVTGMLFSLAGRWAWAR